jgi:hypothetical protein
MKSMTRDTVVDTHPRIAYARPSLLGSVMVATVPRPTPMAPANTPCSNRMVIACGSVVEVPKARQVRELPSKDTKSTVRVPCRSEAVAQRREVRNWVTKKHDTVDGC